MFEGKYLVNSADSHVHEPKDLWVKHMPAKLRARALHSEVQYDPQEVEHIYIDDKLLYWVQRGKFLSRANENDSEGFKSPPGHEDPEPRFADMASQGVYAELLIPSTGLWVYLADDPVLAIAHCRVFNDWVHDTFMARSPRFVGTAMVTLHDVDLAMAEVTRCADLGFKALGLPIYPLETQRYNDAVYEPFWSLVEEIGMVATFHVGTGIDPRYLKGPGGNVVSYVETYSPVQWALSYLVGAGVMERHPTLQFAFIECGASWLAALVERMDEAYRYKAHYVRPKLPMTPGEYIRRQVHVSFQHDQAALRFLDVTGVEAIMFGTDYPHPEGTWPDTQEVLEASFQGVPEEIADAVAGGNFAKLFSVDGWDDALRAHKAEWSQRSVSTAS
jgi:predicted TIM-barrel fold metal-dependent hydrolase